jgi:hypothetical protein
LRSNGLVRPRWKVPAIHEGITVALPSIEKRTNAGPDLPLLLGPLGRLPFLYEIAEGLDPFVCCGLLAPEVEEVHAALWIEAHHCMNRKVAAVRGDGIIAAAIDA